MSHHNKDFEPEEEQPGGRDEQTPLEASVQQVVRSAGNEPFDEEDKAMLWNRIEHSITAQQPKYRRLWWKVAAAATIAALIAAGGWMLRQPKPATQKGVLVYAQQQTITDTSTETRLMLGNRKQVTLSGASASLTYSNNGTQVVVNNDRQYQQERDGETVQYNTLIVPYGRRAKITLEDGSEVWLNAGSRMVYPVAFDGGSREVFLEGEAYFEVVEKAGHPFFVYTKNLKTAVLGTAFNISAYADDAEQSVVLIRGSVKVHANIGAAEQLLQPGYKAGYSMIDHQISKAYVNVQEYAAWKDGRLMFEHAPLPQILKKLGRYFSIRITSGGGEQATFSGDLDLTDDVGNVMDAISASTGLTYEHTPTGIILKAKK